MSGIDELFLLRRRAGRRGAPLIAVAALILLAATLAGCIRTPVRPSVAIPQVDAVERIDERGRYGEAASDAPAALAEFGRLAGRWECRVEERTPDRLWRARAGTVTWTWFYMLGGHAIQDIWEPDAIAGTPAGTNLRVYNDDTGIWHSAWTSSERGQFELWQGAAVGEEVVMQTRRDAARARITFFAITEATFEWRYERLIDEAWQPVLKTSCARLGRRD